MGKKASVAAAISLMTSLNADPAEAAAPGPDFVVNEYGKGPNVVATNHYHPMAGSPVFVALEGWSCNAAAPTAPEQTAIWVCMPSDSKASVAIKCQAGSSSSMGLTPPDTSTMRKMFTVSIDWHR